MKIQLSAVIITYNEERNIERCIKSLLNVADEIVVVDSFSTDKTEEICKKHGVKFICHAFEGHIEQKNWAKDQAQFDFVLSLDADEALDEILQEEIIKLKKDSTFEAYEMNRLTNYCGKWIYHCGWYPDTKLRLWNKNNGLWGGDNPHDKFELTDSSKSIKHLKGNILHYSYYTREDHFKQVEYFTSILAKAQFEKGKKAPFFVLIFSPLVKFFKDYFIKLGFLDGYSGFTICRISAYATFVKYRKLRNLIKNRS